jgi:hypothetical protein
LTKKEIDFIEHYKLGTVSIIDGWEWVSTGEIEQPLKETLQWLFDKKELAQTPLEKDVIKRIMAGIWGKLLEVQEGIPGYWFNPVWGAVVESNIRLKVAQLCLDNNVIPLHIAVDGVLLPAPLTIDESGAMGSWKLSHRGSAFVVSSGICAIEGKNGAGDFSLHYDWLKEQVEKDPKATEYQMSKLSPLTVAKAVQQNKHEKVGELETITRTVDVGYEMKRCYKTAPKNGKQLMEKSYGSEPWDVSILENAL